MDKATLEAAVASKFTAVLQTTLVSTVSNVRYYVANVLDVAGDTARTVNVMYFVMNEGEKDEVAYWGGSEPKPVPVPPIPTFADEARAWLQSQVDKADGLNTIRMFDQFSADNVQERAWARLVMEDAGADKVSMVEIVLWKIAGQFQYKVIT